MSIGHDPSTKRQRVTRLLSLGSLAYASCSVLLLLTGCHRPDTFTTGYTSQSPITTADITYPELARRYNKAVEPLGTLRATTGIEIEWYEVKENGDRRYRSESGDGKLIRRRPSDVAMTVEKLGRIYLWAGSNAESYWLFDRVDDETAYIGSYDKMQSAGRRPFPMPVRPDTVPWLLGLEPMPYDEAAPVEWPEVRLYEGQYYVDVPGMRARMLIDPQTYRPTRVDLTDPAGFSVLTAKLEGNFPVEVEGVDKKKYPLMCEKAEIFVAGVDSRFTIAVDSATTSTSKIKDAMFDFGALNKTLKPDQVIDLDQP